MKKIIKWIFRKFGFVILPVNDPLFKSQNAFLEQKKLLAFENKIVIFDVGAHYGETAIKYAQLFNNCMIYSFEPFMESFHRLKNTVENYNNIRSFNLALSNDIGEITFIQIATH